MTKEDKIILIETLTEDLKHYLLGKIDKIPEDWDGFEIRQLIKDVYKEKYAYLPFPSRARARKYESERITLML